MKDEQAMSLFLLFCFVWTGGVEVNWVVASEEKSGENGGVEVWKERRETKGVYFRIPST